MPSKKNRAKPESSAIKAGWMISLRTALMVGVLALLLTCIPLYSGLIQQAPEHQMSLIVRRQGSSSVNLTVSSILLANGDLPALIARAAQAVQNTDASSCDGCELARNDGTRLSKYNP